MLICKVNANMQAQVNAQNVQGSKPVSTRAAMSQVATSLPAFGSVTQSVNRMAVPEFLPTGLQPHSTATLSRFV